MSTHVYATVPPHPRVGTHEPEPEALEQMRAKSKDWPDARWAACQCVDLGSVNCGHLKFIAVGPQRGVPAVTDVRLTHWSYYFVGWVNLDTGKIQETVT